MTLLSRSDFPGPATETAISADASPFVLLVDDDPTGRMTLARLLDSAGLPCVDVGSGIEALDLCDARRPRLVITDLCMPGLDGRGLGRSLRSRFPGLAMILITAQQLDEAMLLELRGTFDEVLPKPVDGELLLDRISDLARRSAGRRGRP